MSNSKKNLDTIVNELTVAADGLGLLIVNIKTGAKAG